MPAESFTLATTTSITTTTASASTSTSTSTSTTKPLKSCLRSESTVRKTQGDSLKVAFPKSDDQLNSVKEFDTEPEYVTEAEEGQENNLPTGNDAKDPELAKLKRMWDSIDKVQMRNNESGRSKQAYWGRKKQMEDLKKAEKKEKDKEGQDSTSSPYEPN